MHGTILVATAGNTAGGAIDWTGLVFARYGSPGSHRLRLPQGGQLRLLLGESEAAILP